MSHSHKAEKWPDNKLANALASCINGDNDGYVNLPFLPTCIAGFARRLYEYQEKTEEEGL